MHLIAVRHGQTDSNTLRVLQGKRLDESLNSVGREEAKQLLTELANQEISAIYSSSLQRARETAQIIADAFAMEVIINNRLAERDFGNLTGKTWEEITASGYHDLKHRDSRLQYDYRPFGGESYKQVLERIRSCLEELATLHNEQTILFVTHGGIIRHLYDEFKVMQPPHISNSSLHFFEY